MGQNPERSDPNAAHLDRTGFTPDIRETTLKPRPLLIRLNPRTFMAGHFEIVVRRGRSVERGEIGHGVE